MRVVGCFLEHNERFVLLYRHGHKPDGNTWGMPGGKVEQGETDDDAMIRELGEETGYTAHSSQLERLGEFDFVSPDAGPFTYVTYRLRLAATHEVQLEKTAHAKYVWVTAREADAMDDLITGLSDLFKMVGYIT